MTPAPNRSLLGNAEVLPDLAVQIVGGQTLAIPGDLEGTYAVVLFYRGSCRRDGSAAVVRMPAIHSRDGWSGADGRGAG